MDDFSKVATGFITIPDKFYDNIDVISTNTKELETKDVYQLFEERGYGYR